MIEGLPKHSTPDVFPTFSMDRSYSDRLESIDIDLGAITQLMREKGMSDDEIMELSIYITDETMNVDFSSSPVAGRYFRDENKIVLYKLNTFLSSSVVYESSDGKTTAASFDGNAMLTDRVTKTLVHELEHAILARDEAMIESNEAYVEGVIEQYGEKVSYLKKKRIAQLGGAAVILAGALIARNIWDDAAVQVASVLSLPAYAVGVRAHSRRRQKKTITQLKNNKYEIYINRPEEQQARKAADDYDGTLFAITQKEKTYPEGDAMNLILQIIAEERIASEKAQLEL